MKLEKENCTKSSTFCLAPWVNVLIAPNGDVFTCYEAESPEGNTILGNLNNDDFDSIWNNTAYKKIRKEMVEGNKVKQCANCDIKESLKTISSLRIEYNTSKYFEHVFKNDKPDYTLEGTINPIILDLSFSKKCNLKCRICNSYFSSSWSKELKEEKPLLDENVILNKIIPMLDKVKEINLAGGEPLLNKNSQKLLEVLISKQMTNLLLKYNTNGTVINNKILETWNQFKDVFVTISLDGYGKIAEYSRKGSSWDNIEKNINLIKKQSSHVKLTSYSTISIFNIFHFPDYIKYVLQKELFSIDQIECHYLIYPNHYNIQILPADLKQQIKKKYYSFIKEFLLVNYDFNEMRRLILSLKLIINYMLQEDLSSVFPKFVAITKDLDKKRAESFAENIHELANYFN